MAGPIALQSGLICGASGLKATPRNPIFNSGSQWFVDFAERTYLNTNSQGAALAVGSTFEELVSNTPIATVATAAINNGTAGQGLIVASGVSQGVVTVGSLGQYDNHATNAETLQIIWLMLTTAIGAGIDTLITNGATLSTAQVYHYLQSNGSSVAFHGAFGGGGSAASSSLSLNTVYQFAVHSKPSTGLIEVYANAPTASSPGTPTSTVTVAPWTLPSESGAKTTLLSPSPLNSYHAYQFYQENLTVSGAAVGGASGQVALNFAANAGRFT